MSYGLGAYKKTSVKTASKEQILLMLYREAIKCCKKAITGIEEKNLVLKGEAIGKLQDIVIELNSSLDHEVGGEVAKELSSLYDFILFSTTQANINIDKEPLVGVLSVLETLYKGWNDAIKSINSSGTDVKK